MRRLITGIDAQGRSCVTEEAEVMLKPMPGIPGFAMTMLFATHESPPPSRPVGTGEFYDTELPAGHLRWMMIDHAPPSERAPNRTAILHHADSLNLVFVQRGTVKLELLDGVQTLEAGDSFVITGIDHAYTAGPEGCRLVVVTVGTPPLD